MIRKHICQRCGDSGQIEDDHDIGAKMRSLREENGVTAREMARRLGLSAAYICDLELGRRRWNPSMEISYETLLYASQPKAPAAASPEGATA